MSQEIILRDFQKEIQDKLNINKNVWYINPQKVGKTFFAQYLYGKSKLYESGSDGISKSTIIFNGFNSYISMFIKKNKDKYNLVIFDCDISYSDLNYLQDISNTVQTLVLSTYKPDTQLAEFVYIE
jgi:hypothetical protein